MRFENPIVQLVQMTLIDFSDAREACRIFL